LILFQNLLPDPDSFITSHPYKNEGRLKDTNGFADPHMAEGVAVDQIVNMAG
jgi:hypothetical protein